MNEAPKKIVRERYINNAKIQLRAGVFLIIGVLLFSVSLYVIGREKSLFIDEVKYLLKLHDVLGLSIGAPVKLSGVKVGRIGDIEFEYFDRKQNKIREVIVSVYVDKSYQHLVSKDANATLKTQGLLGDVFLNITPGLSKEILKEGQYINHKVEPGIQEIAQDVSPLLDSLHRLSEGLNSLVEDTKENKGILSKIIYSEDLSKDLSASVTNFNSFSESLNNSDGLLGTLLNDKEMAASIKQSVETVSHAANTVDNVSKELTKLTALADKLASLDEILDNLTVFSTDLKRISGDLTKGKGTVGALIQDSTLYDNMIEITDGAKESYLLREAVRMSIDK